MVGRGRWWERGRSKREMYFVWSVLTEEVKVYGCALNYLSLSPIAAKSPLGEGCLSL